MTKRTSEATSESRQAGVLEIEITPETIEAGLKAYLDNAAHDERSVMAPKALVEQILIDALAVRYLELGH